MSTVSVPPTVTGSRTKKSSTVLRLVVAAPLAAIVVFAVLNPIPTLLVLGAVCLPIVTVELLNVAFPSLFTEAARTKLRLPEPKPTNESASAWWLVLEVTVVLGGGLSFMLHAIDDAPLTMVYLACIAMTDACAWAVGSAGSVMLRRSGHEPWKLAPVVSPNKTLIGVVAGLVGGVLLAQPVAHIFGCSVTSTPVLYAMLVVVSLSAVAGDLLESLVKRIGGIKDMSGILPGHGGIMDRIDSTVMAFFIIRLVALI